MSGDPLDETALEQAALNYLGRYAASSEGVRRVLRRRLRRQGLEPERQEAAEAAISAVLAKLARLGYLNDDAFAAARARRLAAQGRPRAAIAERLAAKGIGRAGIDRTLQALADEDPGGDLAAAIAFAEKRKLGPWRREPADDAIKRREAAALARRGFPPGIARRIVEADDADVLAALLSEARLAC
jgi:regulatory protein